MKPVPISDRLLGGRPGFRRLTVGAPRGQEQHVRPIEVMYGVERFPDGAEVPVFVERWRPTAGELELLQAGGEVELRLCVPQLVVHSLSVEARSGTESAPQASQRPGGPPEPPPAPELGPIG